MNIVFNSPFYFRAVIFLFSVPSVKATRNTEDDSTNQVNLRAFGNPHFVLLFLTEPEEPCKLQSRLFILAIVKNIRRENKMSSEWKKGEWKPPIPTSCICSLLKVNNAQHYKYYQNVVKWATIILVFVHSHCNPRSCSPSYHLVDVMACHSGVCIHIRGRAGLNSSTLIQRGN